MRIEIIPNFVSSAELAALNDWTNLGVQNKWLDKGMTAGNEVTATRLTSRLYPERYVYPQFVLDLSARIRNAVGISAYPLIEGYGRDGVVVSYTLPGGNVFKHQDPVLDETLSILRCNVVTQKADAGGELYVNDTLVSTEVGALHCYLVSEHEHYVTTVEGNTPRILWMFGALVPADDWNSGKIQVVA